MICNPLNFGPLTWCRHAPPNNPAATPRRSIQPVALSHKPPPRLKESEQSTQPNKLLGSYRTRYCRQRPSQEPSHLLWRPTSRPRRRSTPSQPLHNLPDTIPFGSSMWSKNMPARRQDITYNPVGRCACVGCRCQRGEKGHTREC